MVKLRSLIASLVVPAMVYLNSFGASIESESYSFQARDGNSVEVKTYSTNGNNPTMIYATYTGSNGKRNCIIDALAEKYNVIAFAPRNSGSLGISKGGLTVGNYINDLEDTIKFTVNKKGERPYGFAMGDMGGYSLGLLISRGPVVKRAVLAAPMIDLLEQAPKSKLPWAKKELEKEIPGALFRFACACACDPMKNGGMIFGEQRFDEDKSGRNQIYGLIMSVLNAEKIESPLKSPTKVILANVNFFGDDISGEEIKRRELAWKNLGAMEVKTIQSNHWFGCNDDEETGFKGEEAGKMLIENGEIKEIFNFLESK